MTAPTRLALRQGSPEWVAARRDFITATDLGVILGLNPWRCEADLADEKLNGTAQEPSLAMRLGSALEPFIAAEYTAQTGREVRRVHGLWRHPTVTWAAASPDWQVVGERRLVEGKTTGSRARFADGVPDDIRAQTAWQMFVADVPVVDVAVLVGNQELAVYELHRDPTLEADLVSVAEDFRRRLANGGPFARNDERIRRDYPTDDGVMLPATPDLIELAHELADARAAKAQADSREKTVASALRAILLGAAGVEGVLTYRKSADSTRTNWPAVALAYRALLTNHADDELDALISLHSETKSGPRVLRLSKETTE